LSVLVDTSVWSLALRRDDPRPDPAVDELERLLQSGELVVTTGIVLQELLQGFTGARDRSSILARFAALPLLPPSLADHVAAADIRTTCRRAGIQIGTVDALLAALCIQHDVMLLSARVAAITPLSLWST
jgi:predicted nucleic acid-binding protein